MKDGYNRVEVQGKEMFYMEAVVKDMNVEAYNSLDELMKHVDVKDKDVYVMPYGGSVRPQLEETYNKLINELN